MSRIDLGMVAVTVLTAVQAALRTFFGLAWAGVLGESLREQVVGMIEVPVANEAMMIVVPFLLLGIAGAVALVGLVLRKPWGYYAIGAVSGATIAYDLWAAATIQSSAVIGLVVPVATLVFLYTRREKLGTYFGVGA